MFSRGIPSEILEGRRVIVVGFARQGQALARWLPTTGAYVVVTDQRNEHELDVNLDDFSRVRFVLGGHPIQLLDNADLICVSGGVPLDIPFLQEARERNIPITNDAHLFLDRSPAPVIGITGSAGKTTTTTLVGQMCKNAGVTTWVGGNIGNVLLDVMMGIRPHHQVVMELSSFQLELCFSSPFIGAILNITPNHLDRHKTMHNYIRAKANIIVHQTANDIAVLGRDNFITRLLEPIVRGHLVWFSQHEIVSDGAFMIGSRLAVTGISSPPDGESRIICDVADIPLRGEHNVLNVLAACAIAGAAGVPAEVMTETIKRFTPVPHRLELVRVLDGVMYVNDSIATAPERVVAALNSYTEPIILLAGGADKKLSWDEMIILARHKTRHIIAFGRDGDIVVQTMKKIFGHADNITRVQTLDEAVALARKLAQAGDVVLLSPGGTSYDAYKDFAERGEHFRQLVKAL